MENQNSKLSKIPKILFYISFAPAALLLISSVISIWNGFPFLFSVDYGWDAFSGNIIIGVYAFFCIIPIFPVCMIYQTAYILREKVKAIKNISPAKFFGVIGAMTAAVIIIALFPEIKFRIDRAADSYFAQQMYKNADEKIDYHKNNIYVDGVFGIKEQKNSCVLIDYDEQTLGILTAEDIIGYFEIKMIPSTEGSYEAVKIKSEYFVQDIIPLKNGGRLVTFCRDSSYSHFTSAAILEFGDGNILYADNITEKNSDSPLFTGLSWSEYYVGDDLKYSDILASADNSLPTG